MNITNIIVWLVPGYIDNITGNPVMNFHLMVRASDGKTREGRVSALLPNWTQTTAQKRAASQTAITGFLQQAFAATIDAAVVWDIYGV